MAPTHIAWYLVIGALLIAMALTGSWVKRLPLTTSLLYMGAGVLLGPLGLGLLDLDIRANARLWEHLTEIAVIISLFSAGLKLRFGGWSDPRWRMAMRLAFGSMLVTVGLIALAGYYLLGLPVGAAVLLGAILAPTDPVLASDVQVGHADDRDRLRFSLTGEAGMNDGTAFPFLMLGLGLLGLHELGPWGWRWVAVDLLWAVVGGIALGAGLGLGLGRLVLHLRRTHREAVGLDDFLALGVIALAYGLSLLVHAYGFLAVFAAGAALRRIEQNGPSAPPPPDVKGLALSGQAESLATLPETAHAYMAQAVLVFNEQMEDIWEVAMVLILGGALYLEVFDLQALWFVPLLFLIIRPVAVWVGLIGTAATRYQKTLMGWFGIRGIGSLYYLAFALTHGVRGELAETLVSLVLACVAVSIVVHGISATPLMERYATFTRRHGHRQAQRG